MKGQVIQALPEHAEHFAGAEQLRVAIAESEAAWAWVIDNRPACLWGVRLQDMVGRVAEPWLVMGPLARANLRIFWRGAPRFVAAMRGSYDRVQGLCDAGNTKWLERLGFVVEPRVLRLDGSAYRYFSME